MKINKKSSKISFSEQDWVDFGKKAGWLDSDGKLVQAEDIKREAEPVLVPERASPAAPAKPDVKPKTTPKEKPGGKPNRRRFPRPNINPAPKGEEERLVAEVSPENLPTITSELKKNLKASNYSLYLKKLANYERNVNINNQNFWKNIPANHLFYQNPFMKDHGEELAKSNYEYLLNRHGDFDKIDMMQAVQKLISLIKQIKEKEQGHEKELEELAKDIVSKEWNIDRDMLDAKSMDETGGSGEDQEKEGETVPVNQRLQQEINKRILLNTIAQGAGLHALLTMHHLGAEKINQIDPELLKLYDEFSNLTSQHYFFLDPKLLEQLGEGMLAEQGMGWSNVEYPDQDADEDANPKVIGKGINFTVLCQELVKGIVSMATDTGIDNNVRKGEDLTEEEVRTILNESDKLSFEPFEIQVGPELWRRFLKAIPEGADKFDLISEIGTSEPEDVYEITSDTVTNPDMAKERLSQYYEEAKENLGITEDGFEEDEFEEEEFEEEEFEVEEEVEEEFHSKIHPEFDVDIDQEEINKELAGLFGKPKKETRPEGHYLDFPAIELNNDIPKMDEKIEKPFWMDDEDDLDGKALLN